LKLYRALIDTVNTIKDDFEISLHYRNVKGYVLRPYSPQAVGFMMPSPGLKSFEREHFDISSSVISNDFAPDKTAFDVVSKVYAAFDLTEDEIPFYDKNKEQFDFAS
jgi:hypothetical protein